MAKIKSNLKSKISNWIAPYNENKEVFTLDGKVIYCLVCNKCVSTKKKYLLDHHSKIMNQIIRYIGNNYVYIIIDKTTDPKDLAIANLLIGKLDGTPNKSYLVACKELESTNYETICQFTNSSLKIFPGIEQKVLIFISDAGTYTIKAVNTCKIFFPKLIHTTCMALVANRILEKIRELYPDINKLINDGKIAFLKAPSRINKYRK
ncbi:Ribonuclease H-like domain,Domain of unknown function DUF659 [Cinara cedri]|uniref:Uncharacterized protein n=1 Tax=Cinara cedri TaxID=506608 RepID=A0A5E4M7U0_9HEMI|nr:Ribonuclease H-like domain,Domain of unknown function DUF659 [Cinara cedri]